MKKISINELFSGIGAQRKALLNIGLDVEVVGISEIDKYAIQSYEAIFGKTRNYGDICTVQNLDYADLWTYSFPCQDISVAGKTKGMNENTRSGLLYQVQRLLEVAKEDNTLPKYLLLENVKNLVGKQFKSQFDLWIKYLDDLGYKTYWQALNAKDYGMPQNRERVFAISIRRDLNKDYEFPQKEKLTKRLVDILEDEVDEKYYLSQFFIDYLVKNSLDNKEKGNGFKFKPHDFNDADVAFSITTKAGQRMTDNFIRKDTKIRKLTPLECWRLMGFNDEDFYKAKNSGVSDTQLYKQAGNSIVISVLEKIFDNLLEKEKENEQVFVR